MRRPGWSLHLVAITLAGCTQVYDYPEGTAEQGAALCDDAQDNDQDGKTDCSDPACAPFCVENTAALCHDGKDNDQDGVEDCADLECAAVCPEVTAAACADKADNDSDGAIDCADEDCTGHCPEESAADCSDGRDNDGDRLSDAADPRCWLHAPPEVQRCAQANGVDLYETFDHAPDAFTGAQYDSAWSRYGTVVVQRDGLDERIAIVGSALHNGGDREGRADAAAAFSFNTTGSADLDQNLGELVREWEFSGLWDDFALGFEAWIPRGALLRVGIVPSELAPAFGPSLPGAESSLFALTLDGASARPTVSIDVNGEHAAAPLPLSRACSERDASCREAFTRVELRHEGKKLRLIAEQPDGALATLSVGAPDTPILQPARLVFWGGSTSLRSVAKLDDLWLHVTAARPCGIATPQIPGSDCEFRDRLRAFGQVISVALGNRDELCAVVGARRDSLGSEPEALTTWTSTDGLVWAPAAGAEGSSIELPEGASPVGAGIVATDDDGFQLAVSYRSEGEVLLASTSAKTCGAWEALVPGRALFSDAEAPSYVIAGAAHHVYFTRPPTDQTQRTLWVTRRAGSSPWLAPELLAELPANAAGPVSVQRIGGDLVLVHAMEFSAGVAGVGLLVGDDGGRRWDRVDPYPIMQIPKAPDSEGGSLAFDDYGVLSAALAWDGHEGVLLYGASSKGRLDTSLQHAAGTARMVPRGQPFLESRRAFPESNPAPIPRCGDQACDERESCGNCPRDCECDGTLLLSHVLTTDAHWHLVSYTGAPAARYLYFNGWTLNWAGGETWAVLPLERAIAGDFELSFDLALSFYGGANLFCETYIGLGTVPDLAVLAERGGPGIEAGVFAHLVHDRCPARYFATPLVVTRDAAFHGPDDLECPNGDGYFSFEGRRRIVLRREANRISVSIARDDGCGTYEAAVDYVGALPELSSLILGDGGELGESPFEPCGVSSALVSDLRLRLLDDAAACPAGKQPCETPTSEPICVDVQRAAEHCGACGRTCTGREVCDEGRCVCSAEPGVLACDGACVDSLTDSAHCGACNHACPYGCDQGECLRPRGACNTPLDLPGEGGQARIDFSEVDYLSETCGGEFGLRQQVFRFTPSADGVATIALATASLAVVEIGVSEEPPCDVPLWIACEQFQAEVGAGQPLMLPVTAATSYYVAVSLAQGNVFTSTVDLTLEVE